MVEWSLNLYNTPFIGYVGELNGTFRKHVLARQQLAREGFTSKASLSTKAFA
jgi:hypothetical protein